MDSTILGMPLDAGEDDLITSLTPICGMVVVKGLDEDGKVRYAAAATPDLESVECLGMARWAVLKLETALADRMRDG